MGKCKICGKQTKFQFPLCTDCNDKKNSGIIVQCDNCGKWHYVDKKCDCTNSSIITKENELTCIVCGEPSNGKHFCINCYKRYKDKAIDLRITNCSQSKILDEYGNKRIKCSNNIWVRSRAEVMINDWLFERKVRIIYEPDFYYKENGENKTFHPDFYLPDYNTYIEYCELTNKPYLRKKEYTMRIYQDNNATVLIMDDKDIEDRAKFFFEKLGIK